MKWIPLALITAWTIGMVSLPAAEQTEPNWDRLAGEIRQLHQQARSAGDLWTCIQLEAVAAAYPEARLRLGNYLGRSEVIGDARFGFAEVIHHHWDRGSEIGVISGRRFQRIDELGRPLQLGVSLPFHAGRANWINDGNLLAVADTTGPWNNRRALFAVLNAENGELRWRREIALPNIPDGQNDLLQDGLALAHDGSAIAAAVFRRPGNNERVLVAQGDTQRLISNLRRPHGIGPQAAWLLADRGNQTLLITVRGERNVDDQAVGPGIALILEGQTLSAVSPNGTVSPFSTPLSIGRRAALHSVSNWAIVDTGEVNDQTRTLIFYRWQDLAANPAAQPVMALENTYSRCGFLPQSLYHWDERTISLLDLSGNEPVSRVWLESALPVSSVWDSHHYTMVSHPESLRTVYNNLGQELWHGAADDAWVHSRRGLVYRSNAEEGPRFTFVHLHSDPLQRREVPLQLTPGWWRIRSHPNQDLLIAENDEVWHELSLESGTIRRSVVKDPLVEFANPPWWRGEANNHGRFFRLSGRLLPKDVGPEGLTPTQQMVAQDGFHAGHGFFILDESEAVWLIDRRGFQELGRVAADVICTDEGEQTLYLARGRNRDIVARLDRGPRLVTNLGPHPGQGRELPSGMWRIDGRNQFSPGRGGRQRWDEDKAGFSPRRLRAGGQSLVVVTQSVILVLEPRALPLVASNPR
ncbi:MAG: hypothetical protein EA402_10795 [Planctomycetota bacterium]|nr:MAG: hypothetical protein EA402_10795 [Planctomycetota bacterium]